MDILLEISFTLKDRVIILDKDLFERKVDVQKGSPMYEEFHRRKGRHYKNLKQGSGWSFPLRAFQPDPPKNSGPVLKPEPLPPSEEDYDLDIPQEVKDFFRDYKLYCL